MRTRKLKTVDGKTYEKVDTSRFFKVRVRNFRSALRKFESINHREIKEMFSFLSVNSILTDKREARLLLSVRESYEESVTFVDTVKVPTRFIETGSFGFNYPKYTPSNFIDQLRTVTETLPAVKWID
jgi:hypothetical protein